MEKVVDTSEVRNALRWARWLHWLLVALVVLLVLAILQLGARVQIQKSRDRRARHLVLIHEARELRWTRPAGWESTARDLLVEARALGDHPSLRDELAAWLTEATQTGGPVIHRRLFPRRDSRMDRVHWNPSGSHLGAAGPNDGWAWVMKPDGPGEAIRVVPERIPAGSTEPTVTAPGVVAERVGGAFVQLVSASDRGPVVRLPLPGRGAARSMAASPDRRWLAVIPDDGSGVELWDLPALRTALGRWKLDWNDQSPSAPPLPPAGEEVTRNRARVLSGAGLVFLVAALAITSQYLLLIRYRQAQASASERHAELRRARESLAHADKMRALGTLAAGVAHDFNNLLSVIQMSRQLIQRENRIEGAAGEHLANIGQAVNQGRSVVRAILGYSQNSHGPTRSLNLGGFLPDLLNLIRHPFLQGLEVHTDIPPDLTVPAVRRGRLEQALINILVNASESMDGRGVLRITARRVTAAGDCVRPARGTGPWIEVEVADEGRGIPEEIRSRIFEPFFSTKKVGHVTGTGLGLATVWRLAEEEDYGLRIHPNYPRGTRFTVLLAAADSP